MIVDTSKTLLLLGGTGFFGKSFLDAHFSGDLENRGVTELIVVARSQKGLKDYVPPRDATNIDARHARLRVVESDLATCEDLPRSDLIIHAATKVTLPPSAHAAVGIDDASLMTRNVSRILRDTPASAQICYVSSGAVYGNAVTSFVPTSETVVPVSRNSFDPKRAYAEEKLASERIMNELGQEGFSVTIARAFTFMGARLLTNHDYALSSFIASARRHEPVHVTRKHPAFRSYMDSRDMVRWLIDLCGAARPGTDVFNVGSTETVELGEVAAKVASRWNVDVIDEKRGDDSWCDQDALVDWYIPDTTKARQSLSLETTTTLDQFLDSVRAGDE